MAPPESRRESWGEAGPGRRHLVLNVDINKTVVMTDSIAGKTASDVVNEELSAACWGTAQDGKWRLQVFDPSVTRPTCDGGHCFVSYSDWVAEVHPGNDLKKLRTKLKARFTCPGEPGESLGPLAEHLTHELRLPDGSEVRLIPAFFELLLYLKRCRRSFSLCFRTFGQDLESVASELTSFCEGRHPLFPGVVMDGRDGEPDYRLAVDSREGCGTFHRVEGEDSLIMGTTEQAGEGKYKDVKDKTLAFYQDFPGVTVYKGWEAVSEYLAMRFSQCGTLGIRDYYAYWKQKGMTSDGGKVFMFELTRSSHQHAVFFDDNLRHDDLYIVQPVCKQRPDQRHCALSLLQSHMCKAEPLHAISDRTYFIKEVLRLEGGYERRLRSRERLRKILFANLTAHRWMRLPRINSRELEDEEGYDPWRSLKSIDMYSRPEPPTEEEARRF